MGHFRTSSRAPVALQVRFRRDENGARLEHLGRTNDLGIRGAYIEAEMSPEVGERIVVMLNAPSTWEPLCLHGEVRWRQRLTPGRPEGFGVHFMDVAAGDVAALYELLHAAGFADATTAVRAPTDTDEGVSDDSDPQDGDGVTPGLEPREP